MKVTWRTRFHGSIDLAVLTGFQLATTDGAIAVRLDLCRSQDQLTGLVAGEVEQVVMTPAVAAELIAALQDHLDATHPLHQHPAGMGVLLPDQLPRRR